MLPTGADPTLQSDQAISAEASNAKLFGKRCTARINAGEYADALEDAKTLVRILPDAPIGYLKAARCYRLLKKLKAAQKMLDMAVECAEDEVTFRAIRTEQRKIVEVSDKLTQERSRPFSDQLPEEIFLDIASYLSQQDRIRAAQVNKTWRTVLHRHPHIWTAMYLHCKHQTSAQNLIKQARRLDSQIKFYENRLPEHGRRNLETLSVHIDSKKLEELLISADFLIAKLQRGVHRFVPTIRNLSFTGMANSSWVNLLLSQWSGSVSLPDLRCVRVAAPEVFTVTESLAKELLAKYPKLHALDILSPEACTAEREETWPIAVVEAQDPGLRRLVSQHRIEISTGQQSKYFELEKLQHLDVGNSRFSYIATTASLRYLRTLCLNNALLCPSFPYDNMNALIGGNFAAFSPFLDHLVELPQLETLKIVYLASVSRLRDSISPHMARPSQYLFRWKAPKLRSLTIENFGSILYSSAYMHAKEQHVWRIFCEMHPQLEELVISKTGIADLEESLQYLPNLQKLLFDSIDLSSTFLKSATSPALPLLRELSVSHCSKILSGDLLRLVQSKNGLMEYLDIDGCTELQKEAVDWLKNNVKEVKWTGWRDKNEKRTFNYRR